MFRGSLHVGLYRAEQTAIIQNSAAPRKGETRLKVFSLLPPYEHSRNSSVEAIEADQAPLTSHPRTNQPNAPVWKPHRKTLMCSSCVFLRMQDIAASKGWWITASTSVSVHPVIRLAARFRFRRWCSLQGVCSSSFPVRHAHLAKGPRRTPSAASSYLRMEPHYVRCRRCVRRPRSKRSLRIRVGPWPQPPGHRSGTSPLLGVDVFIGFGHSNRQARRQGR